jgi:hypothetical protein
VSTIQIVNLDDQLHSCRRSPRSLVHLGTPRRADTHPIQDESEVGMFGVAVIALNNEAKNANIEVEVASRSLGKISHRKEVATWPLCGSGQSAG